MSQKLIIQRPKSMKCKITKSAISGVVTCPPNKSYTHRAIFIASLANGHSTVENVLLSADTLATINACKKFGAEIKVSGSTLKIIAPIKTDMACDIPEIDTENSGTTIRIASGIASLFSTEVTLTGDSSLQKRPMRPLLDALSGMGAKCSSINDDGKPPITIKGRIAGGKVEIPGNVSSQFISALFICAPLTERGINITINGNLVSKPYLDATIATMRMFKVAVDTLIPYKRYNILPQMYKETTFNVPIDSSSLALLLAATVLVGKDITIKGDIGHLPQGDEVFLDILEELGATVTIQNDWIKVQAPARLNGGKFDLNNSPDLLPPLAILALNACEPIQIFNVKHARIKETDRIAAIAQELAKLGLEIQENDDGLTLINSPDDIRGASLDAREDHRLFMAFCIAGMYVGDTVVTDPESVAVSYPDFIEDMNRLGARMEII